MKSSKRKNRRNLRNRIAASVCPYSPIVHGWENDREQRTRLADKLTEEINKEITEHFGKSLLKSIFQEGITPQSMHMYKRKQ